MYWSVNEIDISQKKKYKWSVSIFFQVPSILSHQKKNIQLNLLVIRLISIIMAAIKTKKTENVGKDVEGKGNFFTGGRNTNWCSHCKNQCGVFSKKLN